MSSPASIEGNLMVGNERTLEGHASTLVSNRALLESDRPALGERCAIRAPNHALLQQIAIKPGVM